MADNNELLTKLDTVMVVKENNEPLNNTELRRLQLVQLSLLKELDRVCRKNNIKYTLISGTLLGAVRHHGYIPWDDDADVAMLREEYEKFKLVKDQLDPDICFFQDHETDPEYLWGFGKLRRTGTSHIREGQEHIKCQTGIYIDIFPLDDIPISLPGQMLLDFKCFVLRKMLWAKVAKENTTGLQKLWWSLLATVSKETIYAQVKGVADRSNNSTKNRVRTLFVISQGKVYNKGNPLKERYGMPKEWFLNLDEYRFEDALLFGTKDYDAILKYSYGDYMKLPPEEKRVQRVSYSKICF